LTPYFFSFQDAGLGLVAIGRASGPGRAEEAARAAISSPLLDVRMERVRGLIYAVDIHKKYKKR